MKFSAILLSVVVASAAFANADYGPGDFKAKLAGVGVMSADDGAEEPKPLPPATRIIVPPGNLAVFFLAYDFPEDVKSRLYLHPNFRESILDEDPFGTGGSGLVSGKGTMSRVVILGAGGGEPYDAPLLVKSVRITGEIEAAEDAPRNKSFFICDAPVDVLFANSEEDGKKAKVLEPSPSPKPDPTLGVVDPAEAAKAKSSTPRGFTDNLDEAIAKAKAEGKLVYACFSGSDWCYWCKKLESEVLSKEEFISGVKDDFVLVFIDTPGNKDVLSAHAKAANKELVKKYKVSGFPTALILDGDGKKVGETGYRKGGAAEYVKHLMEFRAVGGKAFAATPYVVEEPGSAKLVFDTSNAPDLRQWTEEKFAPAMSEWVVKLTDIMASDGWKPPKEILFQFVIEPLKSDSNAPAWASSRERRVSLRTDWFRKNLDGEALGATIHELVHIMQNYWTKGQNKDNCPGWASEGYADYIRWFLFEPEADGCGHVRKNIKKCHYNDSYRVTAHFFGFVESRYPGTMKKLNAAMRDHTFDNGKFWQSATGKTVEELEKDWRIQR